jgi:hypothetical protein
MLTAYALQQHKAVTGFQCSTSDLVLYVGCQCQLFTYAMPPVYFACRAGSVVSMHAAGHTMTLVYYSTMVSTPAAATPVQ